MPRGAADRSRRGDIRWGRQMRDFPKKLCKALLLCLLVCIVMPAAAAKAGNIVIVLDPGHGGASEAGATFTWSGKEYKEAELTLKIAAYAKQELETYAGVTVYMTRTSNSISYMDREARVNFAKAKKATALVSIHLNSAGTSTAAQKISYACAMVPSTSKYTASYANKARSLATSILQQLNSRLGISIGGSNGWMFDDELGIILYGMKAKIPSMIIEHCFISNPTDCKKYLSSNAKLKKLGVADATGIAQYYNLKKKSDNTEPETETETEAKRQGWATENGKKCYYIDGVKAKSVWVEIDGEYYYFNKNCNLMTGVFKKGKYLYLTDSNGVRQSGLVKYNGKWYIANNSGRLYTGFVTYGGKRYYLDPSTGAAKTGLTTINGDKYFFRWSTATMRTGWITISGKRYYFGPSTGKLQKNCWIGSKYKKYYLKSDGTPYVNTKKKINGKIYIFDENGICTNYYT